VGRRGKQLAVEVNIESIEDWETCHPKTPARHVEHSRIDAMLLDHMAPSSRQVYEHYKKQYSAMDISVHFEDSVLAFLTQLQEEKKFTSTTLWTVRSLILSYLCHELKIEITDMRTSKWLKKLGGIFNLCDSCYLLLFHTIFDLFYTNTRRKSHVHLLLKRFSSL
jgi:hypothetical protein